MEKEESRVLLFGPGKMTAFFQRLQIMRRGFTLRLRGGQEQRLAACQARLKQFQFPFQFTFNKEEVYYFSQHCQGNKMRFTLQYKGVKNTCICGKTTCQEEIEGLFTHPLRNAEKRTSTKGGWWINEDLKCQTYDGILIHADAAARWHSRFFTDL